MQRDPTCQRPPPDPDAPTVLSEPARALVDALRKCGGRGDKRAALAAGAPTGQAWSVALSECYRARAVVRVKGADVVHALA